MKIQVAYAGGQGTLQRRLPTVACAVLFLEDAVCHMCVDHTVASAAVDLSNVSPATFAFCKNMSLRGDNCKRDVREYNDGQTATLHETARRRSDTSDQLSYTTRLTPTMTRRCGPNPRAMSHQSANIRLKHIPVCVRRGANRLSFASVTQRGGVDLGGGACGQHVVELQWPAGPQKQGMSPMQTGSARHRKIDLV
jgi:hypothetical protein